LDFFAVSFAVNWLPADILRKRGPFGAKSQMGRQLYMLFVFMDSLLAFQVPDRLCFLAHACAV
jgi:hypothetical protein